MTLDEFTKLVAVLYLFLGGLLTAVFAYSQVRNKNNADAVNTLTKSVLDLNERLSGYDVKLAEKDAEISRLKLRVADLERELEGKGRRTNGRQMGRD